jgi:uncharacterized protein YdiU (UPF0061 family)
MTKNKTFAGFNFDNSYINLPDGFYQKILPEPVKKPELIRLNENLASSFGLDIDLLKSQKGAEFFAGNFIAPQSEAIALAYAGHQFGNLVPQLGDGRAVLLGEMLDNQGNRFDIQLKGSGKTKFSRRGDGRAALGPVIREYILSEAMCALGIRTTRSLAFVTTDEKVQREKALPGGIITRIASSHIRVGTFEYFAANGDFDAVKKLADYTINRHYKECNESSDSYLELLKKVCSSQAKLIASWMGVGFIHGVMNTDNTSIAGETIDYGPCAFMDYFNPMQVYSSIDRYGRYAYMNQPYIGQWNLARFAQSILPLLDDNMEKAVEIAEEVVVEFSGIYEKQWLKVMRCKLGLTNSMEEDKDLINELLDIMDKNELDFTNTFRNLKDNNDDALSDWKNKWLGRLQKDDNDIEESYKLMDRSNPVFIPRNHKIEKALKLAVEEDDYSIVDELIEVLSNPYHDRKKFDEYKNPPMVNEVVQATFCGT